MAFYQHHFEILFFTMFSSRQNFFFNTFLFPYIKIEIYVTTTLSINKYPFFLIFIYNFYSIPFRVYKDFKFPFSKTMKFYMTKRFLAKFWLYVRIIPLPFLVTDTILISLQL